MSNVLNAAVGALVLLVLLGSLALWKRAIDRVREGKALVPGSQYRPVPWGLLDLVLALLFQLVAIQMAGHWLLNYAGIDVTQGLEDLAIEQRAQVLLASAVATMATLVITALWLYLRHAPTSKEWGVSRQDWAADLTTGGAAFVMLAPLVYGLQYALVQLVESKHPLLELLKEDPSPRFFAVSAVAAVGVAPLAEEFLYRLLLQGWLARAALISDSAGSMFLGGHAEPASAGPDVARWPIAISAALFALAHATHGPDPIPLFVLAMGLGYLYRQTQRIVPCVVVHFLLNSCTLAMMWVAVQ